MSVIMTNTLPQKVLSAVICLYFDRSTDELMLLSKDLRGAIAKLHPHEILFHQHGKDGLVKYNYPLIQYKCIQNKCLLIGIGKEAELVSRLNLVGETIKLFYEKYKIIKKDVSLNNSPYGIFKIILSYSFLTPWLALNEKNYQKYQRLGTLTKRKELLEKILIGNILSMSKSLGYTVPAPIEAKIIELKEVPTKLKGTPMLGFLGTFSVNFEIPDYWGIGKSVSRGFGTVLKNWGIEVLRN